MKDEGMDGSATSPEGDVAGTRETSDAIELVIDVRGLVKRYGDRVVVHDVDLRVAQGEVLALLGPNGAGKTTTVEILEGLRSADGGHVRVLGRDPWTAPPSWRSRIGAVLQESSDASDLSVREVIEHFRFYYPNPRGTDDLLEAVGLTDRAHARVRTLSGGQRRRLDVALALVGRPELLFLDEPTTGFDPAARRAFWEMITRLKKEGTSMLLTTHYLEEAERLADSVAIVVAGRVAARGTLDDLRRTYGAGSVVSWRDETGRHDLRTDDPAQFLAGLHAASSSVTDVRLSERTLEDIYLELTSETHVEVSP